MRVLIVATPQYIAFHGQAIFTINLAEGLAKIPGFKIDPAKVQTNIVICDITGTRKTSGEISCALAGRQVLANGVGANLLRFVTHLDVNREECAQALAVVAEVCGGTV